MGPDGKERRDTKRRVGDEIRFWLPFVLSLLSTVLALGIVYGKLGGRLDLIEYRLHAIEQRLP
jgi:hypothetical protein